ncbi:Cellulase (glycosyl hydrolase family 5 protein) [Ceratobasidium sp. AG-Ba]|nr:Cellulase (glycosyl hydrolase family 5 protein) [Ceratobasidium sp. AG-Ba]
MVLGVKLVVYILAVLPAVLSELEPHPARTRHRHHTRMTQSLDVDIDLSPANAYDSEEPGQFRFPYGQTKVRGVNLGGWLVLESWITPSLFDATGDDRIIDEYTFGQYQDKDVAKAALQKHWDTWITEPDLAAIAAAGLNHVRVPIGFWAFDVSGGEPYIQGQFPYLCKVIEWAAKHDIKVIIDLHGAPGSQNGFDNSDRAGNTTWHLYQSNVDRTNAIIKLLAVEFSQSKYKNVVATIAPLNEPASFRGGDIVNVTRQYWLDSYQNIRYPFGRSREGSLFELIHDAFEPISFWNGFMTKPNYTGVALDTSICNIGKNDIKPFNAAYLPVITGEFSNALTDCTKNINGRFRGSRYDGTFPGSTKIGNCTGKSGSGADFTDDYKVELGKFFEAQTTTYEINGSGWILWTWKAEKSAEWSYQAGLAGGWIPRDPTERKYSNPCI